MLRGESAAIEVELRDGRFQERFLAKRGGEWIEIARGEVDRLCGSSYVIDYEGKHIGFLPQSASIVDGELVETFAAGKHRLLRRFSLTDEGPWVRVVSRFEPSGSASLRQFADRFRFSHLPDWSYSPSVGGFNPDAYYKAPVILVQSDRTALGIVPDLATLTKEVLQQCSHALDLDVPAGPRLSVGFLPAKRDYHAVYSLDAERVWTTDGLLENAYFILLTADSPPAEAYRQAVRFHWRQFGRAEQCRAGGQQAGTAPEYSALKLWDDWRRSVWLDETPRQWLAVPLPGNSTGGGVATRRWGPGPSVYLSSWFNSLRTAYGMALYARRTGNNELLAKARQTVELALKAPGRDGAFKCVAVPIDDGKSVVWAAGDGRGASTADGFLGYDMCWTGYWLLRWRTAGLPDAEPILPRCQKLARFMLDRQLPDGMLPTHFAEDGSVIEDRSALLKAETAPVALFLLELHAQDPREEYLRAAIRGLEFLEKEVVASRQWYDYETFFSCARRRMMFDPRSGQWPANNLALCQAAAAALAAHRANGDACWLALGERMMDYLLLYQQCWTNPIIQDLSCPTMLLGGFTTQNSDAEWSDARQSQCGNVLLDYYRATGKVEYLERGVAALRSQFPVSPAENWAHVGYGTRAGVSSFHWGTGSGMAGVEIDADFLGDAAVDLAAGRVVGFNGIDAEECRVADDHIELKLSSPFDWPRKARLTFHRGRPNARYRLRVNGEDFGLRDGKELSDGLWFQIR